MVKKFLHIVWSYSLQDYWKLLWSKTEIDEKVISGAKETKRRTKAAVDALKGKKKK